MSEANRVINGGVGLMQDPDGGYATKWQQYTLTQTIDMHRQGWLGAWDAIVAAITKQPRFAVARPVTLSFWAKGNPEYSLAQTQLEVHHEGT